jgi:hypothetical protein
MKLNEFLKYLNKTKRKAGNLDVDVEFLIDEIEYEIDSIHQFSIVPDITIHLKIKE